MTGRILAGLIIVGTVWLRPLAAGTFDLLAVGVRSGVSDSRTHETYRQHEAFAEFELPCSRTCGSGWRVGIRLVAAAGLLEAAGRSGGYVSLGPGLDVAYDGGFVFKAGILPTLLARDTYGDDDLGGSFDFTSYLGLGYRFRNGVTLGWRSSHMSNAGIQHPTPEVNVHMIVLEYRF